MAFSEHPGFKVTSDPRIRKPKGYHKPKSKLRARRHGIASSGTVTEAIMWLRAR